MARAWSTWAFRSSSSMRNMAWPASTQRPLSTSDLPDHTALLGRDDHVLVGLDRSGEANDLGEGGGLHRGHFHVEDPGVPASSAAPSAWAPTTAPEDQTRAGQEGAGMECSRPRNIRFMVCSRFSIVIVWRFLDRLFARPTGRPVVRSIARSPWAPAPLPRPTGPGTPGSRRRPGRS